MRLGVLFGTNNGLETNYSYKNDFFLFVRQYFLLSSFIIMNSELHVYSLLNY